MKQPKIYGYDMRDALQHGQTLRVFARVHKKSGHIAKIIDACLMPGMQIVGYSQAGYLLRNREVEEVQRTYWLNDPIQEHLAWYVVDYRWRNDGQKEIEP